MVVALYYGITALRIYGVRSAGCGLKSQQWNDEVPLNMRNPFRSTRLFGSENYVLRLRYFHSCNKAADVSSDASRGALFANAHFCIPHICTVRVRNTVVVRVPILRVCLSKL